MLWLLLSSNPFRGSCIGEPSSLVGECGGVAYKGDIHSKSKRSASFEDIALARIILTKSQKFIKFFYKKIPMLN